MSDIKEKLFSDFNPVSTQEWMDKIMVDLKGADYEKKLVWRTNEGFKVKPFYRREDLEGMKTIDSLPGQFPYLRGKKKDDNTWYIRQNIVVEDPKEANSKALDLLNRGIDSIGFRINPKFLRADHISNLFNGIYLDCIEINLESCQRHIVEQAQLLTSYLKEKGYKPENIHGSILFDPIRKIFEHGKDKTFILSLAKPLVETLADYPDIQCLAVDSIDLNNAGAYIYQELGYALSWGNEWMSLLTEQGIPAAEAAKRIKFNFGISSNYFMEIAKFRAARMLWANIVKQYLAEDDDLSACKMNVHAITSTFNMTLFDAHVNLLRSQTEAMSAAIAGVDSMTVTPFDVAYEKPDDFSERIARNQQLLLKEESHFNRVVDPAGGSYYIESLTKAIAEQAWALFLKTEDEGGFLASVKAGIVQQTINASNKARHEAVSKRREVLLGTNQFPNFNELANGKCPIEESHACGHSHQERNQAPLEKLCTDRAASQFEALRLQTERSGKRPKAFMLTIGNLAMRQARAQFSCNFLACAGYQVIDNLGFKTVEEGVEAAMKAGADIVVICSSDDEYAQYAIPAFQAVAGRAMFIVAGAPACMEELKAAGIENFIHVRVNVLDTLKAYNEKLGIK